MNWRKMLKTLLLVSFLNSLVGCQILTGHKDQMVKHPDAPMLIMEIQYGRSEARVAVFDPSQNKLVDFGWVDLRTLVGWSFVKYDWEKFLKR